MAWGSDSSSPLRSIATASSRGLPSPSSSRLPSRSFAVKYHIFYAAHFSFLLFYIFAALHTPTFHFYGWWAMAIYGFDKLMRIARGLLSWKKVDKVTLIEDASILRVSIEKPFPINQWWAAPQLGQYVFLNFPAISKFEWHPYTLSSSPLETHLEVNIKALGDHTKALIAATKRRAIIQRSRSTVPMDASSSIRAATARDGLRRHRRRRR